MAEVPATSVVAAAVRNHRSWSATRAELTGGSSVERAGGLVSHLRGTGAGGGDEIEVLFVEPADDEVADLADEVEDLAEAHPEVRSVGWWSATSDRVAAWAPRLLARGFQWGWAPHWMGLDLTSATSWPEVDRVPLPDGIMIREVTDSAGWDVPSLPYHGAGDRLLVGPLARHHPPTVTLAAFEPGPLGSRTGSEDGQGVVGKIVVHVAADDPADAGIYSCGVVPHQRGRGIGAALTAAAADRAAGLGCRLLTLNATDMGEPVYRRVGFASAGWGRTWWLMPRQLGTPRPPRDVVRLVEAVGRGDLDALDSSLASARPTGRNGDEVDLDAPLRCGLTPIGVAVQLGQAGAAQRLVDHGATLDVVSAWDLGWRDRVPALLDDDPDLANRRTGEHGATPLQIAIDRDDEDLARAVLAAGPDLTIRDRTFGSDALGWATHLGRSHLAELIRQSGDD